MSRFYRNIAVFTGLASTTLWSGATVLEDFSNLVDGNTYFAGDWTTADAKAGSTTPQSTFSQGDGTYTIADSGVTNNGASFLEVHFDAAQDLGTANSVFVTAKALAGNAATSFEVRLFSTNGASAFAIFEAASFSGDDLSTAEASIVSEPGFDPSMVEIMRLSGARVAGTAAFGFDFDEIALIPPVSNNFHSADFDQNGQLDLGELLRVIEIYNTRFGTARTGLYKVNASSEDGFEIDASNDGASGGTLARYHSADFDRDAKVSLPELLRVIELYNFRVGTTRTGDYRVDPTSEDGFATGPRD